MTLFKRHTTLSGTGPQSTSITVADLERFGWHSYDVANHPWPTVWADFVAPMYNRCRADRDAFLTSLSTLAEQYGGWAAYGAERLMIEVAGGSHEHPAYGQIMDASLNFLRTNGVPPMNVTGYEWRHWIASGGTNETWLQRRLTPTSEQAPISDLSAGETRRLAQLVAGDHSNVFMVQRTLDGRFRWIVDAEQSDTDPERTQYVHMTAGSLHDLYIQIGLALQSPPHWYDCELEPYFPLPSPAL